MSIEIAPQFYSWRHGRVQYEPKEDRPKDLRVAALIPKELEPHHYPSCLNVTFTVIPE